MAKCDEGYLCEVCGLEVEHLTDSDLYLRYVLGWVDPETLHVASERHLRCNPALAQFVVHEQFAAVACDGPFSKQALDREFVAERERQVTAAWLRLGELARSGTPITEYPTEPLRRRWQDGTEGDRPT